MNLNSVSPVPLRGIDACSSRVRGTGHESSLDPSKEFEDVRSTFDNLFTTLPAQVECLAFHAPPLLGQGGMALQTPAAARQPAYSPRTWETGDDGASGMQGFAYIVYMPFVGRTEGVKASRVAFWRVRKYWHAP